MRFTIKQWFAAIFLICIGVVLFLPYFTATGFIFDSDADFICVPLISGALIGAGIGTLAKTRVWIGIGAIAGAVAGGLTLCVLMWKCFGNGGLCH